MNRISSKIFAVLMVVAMLFSSVAVSVFAQGENNGSIVVSNVMGNAGEMVSIDVSLANNPGFTCMILNISYDMDALELISVSDSGLIPGKNHTPNYNSPYQLTWQNYTAESNFTDNGVIATLTFKIKDSAANGKYDIGVYYDVYNYEVTDAMLNPVSFDLINGSITVGSSESVATYVIDDKITVIEADVKYDSSVGGDACLVSITKGTAKYEFLHVSETTKKLGIEVEGGVYADLYDDEGNAIALDSNDTTPIALIYDDVKGTVRCYVNGKVAYYYETADSRKLVNDFFINDSAFMAATGDEDICFYDGVALGDVYNICDSGTAEVVAFQEHNEDNSIRILAGVDMPWYGLVGFEIEVYKNGVGQGVEILTESTIFESVYANDKTVKAEELGYRYLAACVINDVDISDGSNYYINVKPFTKVGETVYYGSADIINIDANGNYSF